MEEVTRTSLIGNYAFTFTMVQWEGMQRWTSYEGLYDVNRMPPFYRERLNLPQSIDKDVYVNPFTLVEDEMTEVGVLITRTPLCSNGTLKNYGQRLVKNNNVRLQRFGQLVYELTKVTRKLFKEQMFHLDIKQQIFSFVKARME